MFQKRPIHYSTVCVLIISIILAIIPTVGGAQKDIGLYINGEKVSADVSPILSGNRTLAPVRVVSEYLGAPVSWDGATRQVTIQGAEEITLTIDSTQVLIGDDKINLDIPPQIIDNRTYVPLRFVSEALNCNVSWNSEQQSVHISPKRSTIRDVKIQTIADKKALVIAGSGELNYTTLELKEPRRYVMDFRNTELLQEQDTINVDAKGIIKLRTSQFTTDPYTTRLVFDLKDHTSTPKLEKLDNGIHVVWLNNELQGVEAGVSEGKDSLLFRLDELGEYEVTAVQNSGNDEVLYGAISASRVNLRSEPSTARSDTIITTVDGGSVYKVIGQTKGWYQIELEDGHAWVADYLLSIDLTMQRTNVNVRSGPSLDNRVVDMVMRGDPIKVLERESGWVKVETQNNKQGYIADWLVALNDRLVQEEVTDSEVVDMLQLNLKNTTGSTSQLEVMSELISGVQWRQEKSDMAISISLDEPASYEVVEVEAGLEVRFGAKLQDVKVLKKNGGITVSLAFDKPTKYVFHQRLDDGILLLEIPHSVSEEEYTLPGGGEVLKNVQVTNTDDGLTIGLNLEVFSGYKVNTISYSKDIEIVLFSSSLSDKTIAIDVGHGGSDTGAIGYNGVYEKNINLAVALQLRELLQQKGATVVMTRDTDVDAPYRERPDFINASGADLMLSIHSNAFNKSQSRGIETLYYPRPENERFALLVQKSMLRHLGFPDRGIVPRPEIYITREVSMPSALAEMGFLTNPYEGSRLIQKLYQGKAAQSLVEAIENYFAGDN